MIASTLPNTTPNQGLPANAGWKMRTSTRCIALGEGGGCNRETEDGAMAGCGVQATPDEAGNVFDT
ncbi:MAG: hypothetical protein NVS4B11_31500 [Ktedonobacteraceae bacterium]